MPSAWRHRLRKMEKEGFTVPEKIKQMLAAENTTFYKTDNGQLLFYDYAAENYKQVVVSENIVSLKALKGANKVVKTCPFRISN